MSNLAAEDEKLLMERTIEEFKQRVKGVIEDFVINASRFKGVIIRMDTINEVLEFFENHAVEVIPNPKPSTLQEERRKLKKGRKNEQKSENSGRNKIFNLKSSNSRNSTTRSNSNSNYIASSAQSSGFDIWTVRKRDFGQYATEEVEILHPEAIDDVQNVFYVSLKKPEIKKKYKKLFNGMDEAYKDKKFRKSYQNLHSNDFIAVNYQTHWYRGIVQSSQDINKTAEIYLMDTGLTRKFSHCDVFKLHRRFAELNQNAIACCLSDLNRQQDEIFIAAISELFKICSSSSETVISIQNAKTVYPDHFQVHLFLENKSYRVNFNAILVGLGLATSKNETLLMETLLHDKIQKHHPGIQESEVEPEIPIATFRIKVFWVEEIDEFYAIKLDEYEAFKSFLAMMNMSISKVDEKKTWNVGDVCSVPVPWIENSDYKYNRAKIVRQKDTLSYQVQLIDRHRRFYANTADMREIADDLFKNQKSFATKMKLKDAPRTPDIKKKFVKLCKSEKNIFDAQLFKMDAGCSIVSLFSAGKNVLDLLDVKVMKKPERSQKSNVINFSLKGDSASSILIDSVRGVVIDSIPSKANKWLPSQQPAEFEGIVIGMDYNLGVVHVRTLQQHMTYSALKSHLNSYYANKFEDSARDLKIAQPVIIKDVHGTGDFYRAVIISPTTMMNIFLVQLIDDGNRLLEVSNDAIHTKVISRFVPALCSLYQLEGHGWSTLKFSFKRELKDALVDQIVTVRHVTTSGNGTKICNIFNIKSTKFGEIEDLSKHLNSLSVGREKKKMKEEIAKVPSKHQLLTQEEKNQILQNDLDREERKQRMAFKKFLAKSETEGDTAGSIGDDEESSVFEEIRSTRTRVRRMMPRFRIAEFDFIKNKINSFNCLIVGYVDYKFYLKMKIADVENKLLRIQNFLKMTQLNILETSRRTNGRYCIVKYGEDLVRGQLFESYEGEKEELEIFLFDDGVIVPLCEDLYEMPHSLYEVESGCVRVEFNNSLSHQELESLIDKHQKVELKCKIDIHNTPLKVSIYHKNTKII